MVRGLTSLIYHFEAMKAFEGWGRRLWKNNVDDAVKKTRSLGDRMKKINSKGCMASNETAYSYLWKINEKNVEKKVLDSNSLLQT